MLITLKTTCQNNPPGSFFFFSGRKGHVIFLSRLHYAFDFDHFYLLVLGFFSSKYYTCSRLDPELTSIVDLIRAARTHAPSSSFTPQHTC